MRWASGGPKEPTPDEIAALQRYLDARRDTDIGFVVQNGVVSLLTATLTVVADARYQSATVHDHVRAALVLDTNDLAARNRELGQALDHSDVLRIVQAVPGVLGVTMLDLAGLAAATPIKRNALGRRPAAPHELLLLGDIKVMP